MNLSYKPTYRYRIVSGKPNLYIPKTRMGMAKYMCVMAIPTAVAMNKGKTNWAMRQYFSICWVQPHQHFQSKASENHGGPHDKGQVEQELTVRQVTGGCRVGHAHFTGCALGNKKECFYLNIASIL
mmetsp:Transcript_8552/g.21014  ORF Transcript_8552/g.21014 Transcript_8552/m.21014 type:complete len:126 (+) Transcript_8552:335-712(+)